MGKDLLDFTHSEMNGTPKVEGDANSPAAAAVGTRSDLVTEATRSTEVKAVAGKMPSTDAACVNEINDDVLVFDGGRETDAPGVRHEGEGLTIDELKGLRRLEKALGEQKGCIQRARNDAMVSIKNELVFTEMDTLVMIAIEAVDRVIGTSARFIREAQDQAPGAPDTRGRKKPLHTMQLENQRRIT